MTKVFWKILYYFIISPLIILLAHIAGIFSRTVRKGLIPRYRVFKEIRNFRDKSDNGRPFIIFHAASLGEYEHIKPVLKMLHETHNSFNVVTFFSPSGYDHTYTNENMQVRLYMPFDLPFIWGKFYRLTNPRMIIIAKHDVWPAQVWTARRSSIPIYLINASLAEQSTRTKWYIKSFLKHVYRDFTQICAISAEDQKRFSRFYPRCNVSLIGDTKYDQVVLRKKEAISNEFLPTLWKQKKWLFVAGSVWPEDTQHLFPGIKSLLRKYEHLLVIIVPHQPHIREVERIENEFGEWKTRRYSDRDMLTDQRVLIVDSVGLLAALYSNAHVAYVGGSFKQGVHNVMEPSIYGIPVIYGPIHTNSYEAIRLKETGGGKVINHAQEFEKQMVSFLDDEKQRIQTGKKAAEFALQNTGATNKLLKLWEQVLGQV